MVIKPCIRTALCSLAVSTVLMGAAAASEATGIKTDADRPQNVADQSSEQLRFGHVFLANETGRTVQFPRSAHGLSLVCEALAADGQWHTVATLEAPLATSKPASLHQGEIWQFIVPLPQGPLHTKVRFVTKGIGATFCSALFDATIDPSLFDRPSRSSCYLARLRVQPNQKATKATLARK
ncbi:MAG: hypothetical protein FGM15_08170 [Chthoniobacterales bacterium]|nr:hypothetical protein [Chthoniobacterales bacterium]